MTDVPTKEGWLCLALVLDLYARKLVGWAMSETMPGEMTLEALNVALGWCARAASLTHHTDCGSPYAASDRQDRLEALTLVCHMSSFAPTLLQQRYVDHWITTLRQRFSYGLIGSPRPVPVLRPSKRQTTLTTQ